MMAATEALPVTAAVAVATTAMAVVAVVTMAMAVVEADMAEMVVEAVVMGMAKADLKGEAGAVSVGVMVAVVAVVATAWLLKTVSEAEALDMESAAAAAAALMVTIAMVMALVMATATSMAMVERKDHWASAEAVVGRVAANLNMGFCASPAQSPQSSEAQLQVEMHAVWRTCALPRVARLPPRCPGPQIHMQNQLGSEAGDVPPCLRRHPRPLHFSKDPTCISCLVQRHRSRSIRSLGIPFQQCRHESVHAWTVSSPWGRARAGAAVTPWLRSAGE